MPIGLAGFWSMVFVWLIQLLPSPDPSPAPFGVPTLPAPTQARGPGGYLGGNPAMYLTLLNTSVV